MICNENEHSILGQFYFKNKLIEKEIRFVVIRGWEMEGEEIEGSQSCKLSVVR